jgi:peptidoglycan hydrolase-like protein with peptidoglycan-binding domain
MPAIPVVPVIPAQGPPLGADHGYPSQPYQDHSRNGPPAQPAYDQPIDYQAATDRPYSEPYEGPYADDHPDDGHAGPRSNRAAMIGVGVAAAAILVIIVSLITLGGGKSTPPAPRGNSQPTEVVTPTTQPQKPAATPPPTAPTSTATVPAGHVPGQLRLGDTGAEVKWLQNRLKQLNFYDGDATGTFDQATAAAVVAFQAHAHTADPSGVVARSTKTALIAAGAKPKMSILTADPGGKKKGAPTPDDVKRLQRALSVALSQDVKASGNYDMATVGAVMQYEAAVGLGPDGMVGDRVWGALQQGKLTG